MRRCKKKICKTGRGGGRPPFYDLDNMAAGPGSENRNIVFKQASTGLYKKISLLSGLLFFTQFLFAHSINYALQNAPVNEVVWFYLTLGFKHIIPSGIDHILFVTGLCLLSTDIKTIFWQATAFTVAHSITLALSMKNIIVAPGAVVEPVIALSIVFVAIENMLLTELKPWRVMVVFLFGLIHGMGFASALNEIGLPAGKFYTSILAFNAGVELGQISVITAMFACIIIPLRNKTWYRAGVVYPLSGIIAFIASWWTIQQEFFLRDDALLLNIGDVRREARRAVFRNYFLISATLLVADLPQPAACEIRIIFTCTAFQSFFADAVSLPRKPYDREPAGV